MKPLLLAGTFISFFVFTGCSFDVGTRETVGPLVDEPINIEVGSAERANVELDMGVGELRVSGGGSKLVEGNVEYNVARWKPQIKSSQNGSSATVTIRQPEDKGGHNFGDKTKNQWDLRLADKALLDLNINCGVGQSRLDLGGVLLRGLQVKIGVGEVDLDLTGTPKHDYEVKIEGGVGQAKIHLPQGVGIWASANGGIGSINVTGLQKQGDHWENDLYDKAKVNVRFEINGGIGEIRLIG